MPEAMTNDNPDHMTPAQLASIKAELAMTWPQLAAAIGRTGGLAHKKLRAMALGNLPINQETAQKVRALI